MMVLFLYKKDSYPHKTPHSHCEPGLMMCVMSCDVIEFAEFLTALHCNVCGVCLLTFITASLEDIHLSGLSGKLPYYTVSHWQH